MHSLNPNAKYFSTKLVRVISLTLLSFNGMNTSNDCLMRQKIDSCLQKIGNLLEENKTSRTDSAERVSHVYDDKFLLANHLVSTAFVCYLNAFELLGLSSSVLASLKGWSVRRGVSLHFKKKSKCEFVKEVEHTVDDPSRVQVFSTLFGQCSTKVISKIREYVYAYEEAYTLRAHSGVGADRNEIIVLHTRTAQMDLITRTKISSLRKLNKRSESEVNITWLLKCLDDTGLAVNFEIDRSSAECHTPRRNNDVEAALKFSTALRVFCREYVRALTTTYEIYSKYRRIGSCKIDIDGVTADGIFLPVVPLLEQHGAITATVIAQAEDHCASDSSSTVLQRPVVNQLLDEQRHSLEARCAQIDSLFTFPRGAAGTTTVYTPLEARFTVVLEHISNVDENLQAALDFIEQMIRAQLVAAVGKELAVKDFAQYMTFHNRKVFKEQYQPKPFSYAVRRSPAHSPEGQIQIETAAVTPAEPIYTVSHGSDNAAYMEFALNATTTVKFGGERHLHGWMAHRFSDQALPELKLIAQARQFSSYIVLIGRIASAKLFQPKYGFIVQNKDEISIPLELEQIPTAKEFKDAISSLSPEQQRFAKAFRSMQLESTLFGVCVIQIKPQLEKVLKLQADSLTKEIKLTQDLMQLFIKYQIPSDLLSYEQGLTQQQGHQQQQGGGEEGPSAVDRLVAVKKRVQAMQEMLAAAKDGEVTERIQDRDLRATEATFGSLHPCSKQHHRDVDDTAVMPFALAKAGNHASSAHVRCRYMLGRSSLVTVAPPPPAPPAWTTSAPAPPPKAGNNAAARPSQFSDGQVDYTKYPNLLEEMYTKYDPAASLRPTIINPGKSWTKRSQAGLLSTPVTKTLGEDQQAQEKNAAFDLLDALTRSGALPVEHASLHVIIAATHCFDQSLMDTVVKRNVNPIERVERSTLIMAAALNGVPAVELIGEGQVERVSTFSPMLFEQHQMSNL